MDQLDARELINNGWFIISFCLVLLFILFLSKEMKQDGWYGKVRNQAALSLSVYFLGETIARGWGTLLFYKMQHGNDLLSVFAVEEKYPVAMVGAGIAFIGAICCMRVFSPPHWGKAWLVVVGVAVAFMIVTYVT